MINKSFRDPTLYTTDRGLTKKDQDTPIKVLSADASWMKASIIEGAKSGTITVADTFQKFVPYQARFESTKNNNSGLITQSTKSHPWVENTPYTWGAAVQFPPTFKGDLDIEKWYSSRLHTTKEIYQWKTDIFGNQYGLYKSFNNNIFERQTIAGDFWVTTSSATAPASSALEEMFINYSTVSTTIHDELLSNQILDIDVFYDTLMYVTPTHIILDKIIMDYDSGKLSSNADEIKIISLSGSQYAGTWFFEKEKKVMLSTIALSGNRIIPTIYEYDINNVTLIQKDISGSVSRPLFISQIDTPQFLYNSDSLTYSISFTSTQGRYTTFLDIEDLIHELQVKPLTVITGDAPSLSRHLIRYKLFDTDNKRFYITESSAGDIFCYVIVGGSMLPVKLTYPFDAETPLINQLITDAHPTYKPSILNSVKDITINKDTIFFLTGPKSLSDVFASNSTPIGFATLGEKTELIVDNKYVSASQSALLTTVNSDGTVFFLQPKSASTIKIFTNGKALTVTANGNGLYLADEITSVTDTQLFDYTFTNSRITLRTRMAGQKYLGAIDGYIAPIDSTSHNFLVVNSSSFNTNFDPKIYSVTYFGEDTAVDMDKSRTIEDIVLNMLVSAPIKSSITLYNNRAEMAVNIINLKNLQTPEYKYSGIIPAQP